MVPATACQGSVLTCSWLEAWRSVDDNRYSLKLMSACSELCTGSSRMHAALLAAPALLSTHRPWSHAGRHM